MFKRVIKKIIAVFGKLFRKKSYHNEIIEDNWEKGKSTFNFIKSRSNELVDISYKLRNEIKLLEDQKLQLDRKIAQLTFIQYATTKNIDKKIENLVWLAESNKSEGKVSISESAISRTVQSLKKNEGNVTKFLLLDKFKGRERDKLKREIADKKKIKTELYNLNSLIDQNRLVEAKTQIYKLTDLIKPYYQDEYKRFEKAILRFKDKELNEIKIQQERALKKIEEEIKSQKLLFEQREDELRIQKEQRDLIEQNKLQKIKEEKLLLQNLQRKKSNWIEFEDILKGNNIYTLYHFTDRANIKSIRKAGGLFSWHYCDKKGIQVPFPGGDALSRDLDTRYNLQDFVRTSFCNNHPMMFTAKNKGQIYDPVVLQIKVDVCFFEDTMFSDMNATKNEHKCGKTLDDLKKVKFNIVKWNSQFDPETQQKSPFYQAEVLVKTWIPLEFITNITDL